MNMLPLVTIFGFFQKGDYSPESSTGVDYTIIFIIIFLVIVVIVSLVVMGVIVMIARRKGSEPQALFDEPPTVEPKPVTPRPAPSVPARVAPEPAPTTTATPAIFISYRREDSSDVTGRIYDRLCLHFGKENVFKDVDSIPLGVDFRKHLGDSVGQCNVLLTVIGRSWLTGEKGKRRLDDNRDFVRIEMEAALKRDIPVVPVLVQGSSMPELDDLPEILQSLVYRNGIPVRPDPDFHGDMDRLIKGIERYLKKSSAKR